MTLMKGNKNKMETKTETPTPETTTLHLQNQKDEEKNEMDLILDEIQKTENTRCDEDEPGVLKTPVE